MTATTTTDKPVETPNFASMLRFIHQLKAIVDIEQETALLRTVFSRFTQLCEVRYGLSREVEQGLVTRSPSDPATIPSAEPFSESDTNALNTLVIYLFDRRFGWSEFGSHNSEHDLGGSGNWSEVFEREVRRKDREPSLDSTGGGNNAQETEARRETKTRLNDALDKFLRFWLSIPLNPEFVAAILYCAKHTLKPVVRRQCFDHFFDWMRAQGPAIQSRIGECFEPILHLLLNGFADIWSPIRKHCASKVSVLAEHMSADHYESLFCSLVDLCLDDSVSWQATEGAILGITTLIKRFRWEAREHSPSRTSPDSSGAMGDQFQGASHVLTTGRIVVPHLPTFITDEIRTVLFRLLANPQISIRENATKAFAAFLSRSLFEETLTSFTEVVNKLTPLDLRSDDPNSQHGNQNATHEFLHMVSHDSQCGSPTRDAKPSSKSAASTPKAGASTESPSSPPKDLHRTSNSRDPMRRLKTLSKSTSSPEVLSLLKASEPNKLLDPYEAEGLLSVCGMLVRQIPASFLYPKWPEFFPTLNRYLAHPASTVRQSTSTIFKYFVMKEGGSSQLTHLALQSLTATWTITMSMLSPPAQPAQGSDELVKDLSRISGLGGSAPSLSSGTLGSTRESNRSLSSALDNAAAAQAQANLPDQYVNAAVAGRGGSESKTWQWREGRLLAYELILKFFLSSQSSAILTSPSRRQIHISVSSAHRNHIETSPATPVAYQFSPNPNTVLAVGGPAAVGDHLGAIDLLRDLDQQDAFHGSDSPHTPVHRPTGSIAPAAKPSTPPASKSNGGHNFESVDEDHASGHHHHHHTHTTPHNHRHNSSTHSASSSESPAPQFHRRQSTSAVSMMPLWTLRFKRMPVRDILRQMLFQTMQGYGDARWEVRRMSEQVLKPLTEVIFWFDVSILREIWDVFLVRGTGTMPYVARLTFKYTVKRAASMQISLQGEHPPTMSPTATPSSPGGRARLFHLVDAVRGAVREFVPSYLRDSASICSNEKNSLLSLELVMLCHIHFGSRLAAEEQAVDVNIILERLEHYRAQVTKTPTPNNAMAKKKSSAIERLIVTALTPMLPDLVPVCDFNAHLRLLPLLVQYVSVFEEQEVQMAALEATSRLLALPLMWLAVPSHTRAHSSPEALHRARSNFTSPITVNPLQSPTAPHKSPPQSLSMSGTGPMPHHHHHHALSHDIATVSRSSLPDEGSKPLSEVSGPSSASAIPVSPVGPTHVRRSLSGWRYQVTPLSTNAHHRSSGLFGYRFCQPPRPLTDDDELVSPRDEGETQSVSRDQLRLEPGRLTKIVEGCVDTLAHVIESKVLEASLMRRVLEVVHQLFLLIGDLRFAPAILHAIYHKLEHAAGTATATTVLPLLSNDINDSSPVDDDGSSGESDHGKDPQGDDGASDGEEWDDDWDDWDEDDDQDSNVETTDFAQFLHRLACDFATVIGWGGETSHATQGEDDKRRDSGDRPTTPVRGPVVPEETVATAHLALLTRRALGMQPPASSASVPVSFASAFALLSDAESACLQGVMDASQLSEIEIEARSSR